MHEFTNADFERWLYPKPEVGHYQSETYKSRGRRLEYYDTGKYYRDMIRDTLGIGCWQE